MEADRQESAPEDAMSLSMSPFRVAPFNVSTDLADLALASGVNGATKDDPACTLAPQASLLQPVTEDNRLSFRFQDINAEVLEPTAQGRSVKSLGASFRATTQTRRQILHNINGCVEPGEILALMGPSGSGKTTMLSVLAGRAPKSLVVTGKLLCNGAPLSKSQKRRIGFVLQDDVLFESLTVHDTLMYSALLRLPEQFSQEDKMQRVERVLGALGLQKCRDTIIGGFFARGVSGGERKRTSIGVELLINPSIIMLDEPTSGLDSTTSMQLLRTLRRLAGGGRAIITTIHQPSSRLYLMLDKLLLLAEGHTMYYGKAQKVVDWFQHQGFVMPYGMNVADFVLDLAMGEIARHGDGLTGPASVEAMYTTFEAFRRSQTDTTLGFRHTVDLKSEGLSSEASGGAEVGALHSLNGVGVLTEHEQRVNGAKGGFGVGVGLKDFGTEKGEGTGPKPDAGAPVGIVVEEPGNGKDGMNGLSEEPRQRVGAPYWQQVKVLWLRCIQVRKADRLEIQDLMQVFLIGLFTSLFWWQRGASNTVAAAQDVYGLLYIELAYTVFTTLFSALFAFAGDVKMLVKERRSGMYQLSAYYIARTFADLPMECFNPTLFVVIIYFTGHLRLSALAFFSNWLSIMLCVLVAQAWGLLIGALSSHPKTASTTAMVYVVVAMMVSGYYVRYLPAWISWTKYLSFLFWGLNLLLKVEFNGRHLTDCLHVTDGSACMVLQPQDLKKGLHLMVDPNQPVWPEVVFMVVSLVLLRSAVYMVLRHKTSST